MISALQTLIDNYIRTTTLRSVNDIIYIPEESTVVVLRKPGHKNVSIDLSEAASPNEGLERIINHLAVY